MTRIHHATADRHPRDPQPKYRAHVRMTSWPTETDHAPMGPALRPDPAIAP